MKPKGTPYTVDFYTEGFPVPQPGDVVLDVSHTQAVRGYFRVLASRQVKVRVSRGEVARFALRIQRLTALPDGAQVAFTVYGYAPKPRGKKPISDRFSPLLPPE